MSLRDYFASAVLQGIVGRADMIAAIVETAKGLGISSERATVSACYAYADMMLKERAK